MFVPMALTNTPTFSRSVACRLERGCKRCRIRCIGSNREFCATSHGCGLRKTIGAPPEQDQVSACLGSCDCDGARHAAARAGQ